MDKIKVKLQEKNNPYVKVLVTDRFGNKKYIEMHGYLVGMETAFFYKKKQQFHNLVILTGDVGVGKSTLIEGLAGVNSSFEDKTLNFNNVAWATEKFIEKTDRDDNIGEPLWWDESIQGASSRNMAITNVGNKLKMAFVTKRFKKHTYYLAIDEINEYAWKLIKMADVWINVRKIGMKRGYFDVYSKKAKIKFIYNAFKFYNKTWTSKEVRSINPDCKGKFQNYQGLFLDTIQYNKLKLEETQQIEEGEGEKTWTTNKVKAIYLWAKNPKYTYEEIAGELGMHTESVGRIIREFKNYQQTKDIVTKS